MRRFRLPLLLCLLAISGCAGPRIQATFSPDGKALAFTWDDRGLHQINADGTGFRQLVSGKKIADPVWSPNGKWLVYTRLMEPAKESPDRTTALYDVSESSETAVFPNLYPPFAWSDDGAQLAGFSFREDGWQQFRVIGIPDGGTLRQAGMRHDSMTPTGEIIKVDGVNHVAFIALTRSGAWNLYAVRNNRPLRLTNSGDVFAAAYNPNSRQLLYARVDKKFEKPPTLWSLSLKDHRSSKLPFRWEFGENTPHGQQRPGLIWLGFTPGADRILFEGGTQKWQGLYTCDLDGSGVRPVLVNRGKALSEEMLPSVHWDQTGERFVAVGYGKKPILRVYPRDGSEGKALPIPDPPREDEEPKQLSYRQWFRLAELP